MRSTLSSANWSKRLSQNVARHPTRHSREGGNLGASVSDGGTSGGPVDFEIVSNTGVGMSVCSGAGVFGASPPLLLPIIGTIYTIATRVKVIVSGHAGQDNEENLKRILSPVVSVTFFTRYVEVIKPSIAFALFNNPFS